MGRVSAYISKAVTMKGLAWLQEEWSDPSWVRLGPYAALW